jgi:multidrug efflux pump subunit AcrA (membrane-fusion protein)
MKRISKVALIAGMALFAASLGSVAVGQRGADDAPLRNSPRSRSSQIVANNCLVALVEERNVPAEEAGVLVSVNVKEGDRVSAFKRRIPRLTPKALDRPGTVYPEDEIVPLAEIDKSLPLLQREVAAKEYVKAIDNAKNPVSIDYAKKQRDVARANFEKGAEANRRTKGAISEMELTQRKLEWEAGDLRIQQAEHDQKQATLDSNVKAAELANAEQAMDHRDIHSPIDGVVIEVYVHEGEWVRPGDPVFRIINLNKLRVQAHLDSAACDPKTVRGREVLVTTTLVDDNGGSREVSLPGRVVFVNPEIKSGGRFSVWAEVENKQANGDFILWPGMKADMIVDLNSTPKFNENVHVRSAE